MRTFRRVRSTIEHLGGTQPREVLIWITSAVGVGNVRVNAAWWDVNQLVERANVALDIDGNGTDDSLLRRAIDEILSTCNYHLNVQ